MNTRKMVKQQLQKKICFVIMPFSTHAKISSAKWSETYEHFFKPAIESAGYGYECRRSEIAPGSFTKEIVENMKNAHLVLADITGFNGNVMWELGVRHSLSPRTIIVTNKDIKAKKFISDLSIYGIIEYSTKGPKQIELFKKSIKKILKKIKENPEKPDNPVFDFLKIEDLVMKSYEELQIRNKLTGLLSELIENIRKTEIHTEGEKPVSANFVNFVRLSNVAIQELIVTNYVYRNELNPNLASMLTWINSINKECDLLSTYMNNPQRSDKDRKKRADSIIDSCKEVKKRSEINIKKINKILKENNETISDIIPNAIIFDEKHRKLIE